MGIVSVVIIGKLTGGIVRTVIGDWTSVRVNPRKSIPTGMAFLNVTVQVLRGPRTCAPSVTNRVTVRIVTINPRPFAHRFGLPNGWIGYLCIGETGFPGMRWKLG